MKMHRTPPPGTLTGTAAATKSVDPATIKDLAGDLSDIAKEADENKNESSEIPASRRTVKDLEDFDTNSFKISLFYSLRFF